MPWQIWFNPPYAAFVGAFYSNYMFCCHTPTKQLSETLSLTSTCFDVINTSVSTLSLTNFGTCYAFWCHYKLPMTVWILVGCGINFAIAVDLIRLYMPGVKQYRVQRWQARVPTLTEAMAWCRTGDKPLFISVLMESVSRHWTRICYESGPCEKSYASNIWTWMIMLARIMSGYIFHFGLDHNTHWGRDKMSMLYTWHSYTYIVLISKYFISLQLLNLQWC